MVLKSHRFDYMRDRLTPAALRNRAGITQKQLAAAVGRTPGIVSKWERFEKSPRLSPAEMKRLLVALDCTLDEAIEAFDRINPSDI